MKRQQFKEHPLMYNFDRHTCSATIPNSNGMLNTKTKYSKSGKTQYSTLICVICGRILGSTSERPSLLKKRIKQVKDMME